jgi:SAM-dependent methyltransferase
VDPRRARSFGAAAQAYAAARPTYPLDAVRSALPPGARRVLDLGAGTGKLTSALLELGVDVVAVEPDDAMRALVDPRATALAGTAEQVPLGDDSVDAVVVGQAWHWFDPVAAVASVQRVLRPGGGLGLLWNLLDDSSGWAADVVQLVNLEDRVSLAVLDANDIERPVEESAGFAPWTRRLVPNPQPSDADLFLQNLSSRSVVILLEPATRTALLDRVRAVLPSGPFEVPWVTETWTTTLL